MKILVVCQYYYPEPFRITDICEELVKRGNEVKVLTGEPNYPEGELYSGYENHERRDEIINGVEVHRCRIVPRKTGPVYRFLNYYSFVLSSLWYINSGRCLSSDNSSFDLVFVNQLSPVMMAYAGIAYKKRYKKPLILYCLDLWPESLLAGGIKKDSIVYKLFHLLSKRIYNKPDRLCVSSQLFSDYFQNEFNIDPAIVDYLPQYAEDLFGSVESKDNDTKEYHFTFAGNIGSMQSVDTILEAAESLLGEPVRFHIVGSGSELNNLQTYADTHDLSNVFFHGRQPLEKMPFYYKMSDAMLITLKADPVISLTLPGKVQTYMAAGKPIIGAVDGETNAVIHEANCGYCGAAGDAEELASNILKYLQDENKEQLGLRGKEYYDKHFSKTAFMKRMETIIESAME